MRRLDVRIKTKLEAKVTYISREERVEELVTIKELSLSGALVFGLTSELNELFSIKPILPDLGEVYLQILRETTHIQLEGNGEILYQRVKALGR